MKTLTTPLSVLIYFFLLSASCTKNVENKKPQVDAGSNVTITLSLDSVLLSGTASDPDDEISGYLWSKVSGDGSSDIVNPGSLSTWIKNLEEGSYVFQLMATDSRGATSADTVSITVLPAEMITLTAIPHNNSTEIHLFGNSNGIDQTDPIAPEIAGGSGTYLGDPVNVRALLKFDLSSIPANATIISAKLTLYSNPTPLNGQDNVANYGTDNTLYIQRVSDSWDPQNITWLNQPTATTNEQIVVPHTDEDFLDLIDLDVKNLVSGMIGANANNGFLIKLKSEVSYTWRIFCSSKYSDEAKHPKLEVVYSN